jgi:DHA1 family tetracycline resistance protein-like MFS transporter
VTPLLGQLSDHIGRRPVLLFCLLGTSFGYVLFALGIVLQSIPLLFLSRAIDGLTGGNISVAQAVIADSTPPEKRARAFGLMGAAFGIGFIVGPFLGGTLSDPSILPWFNATTPFWFAAILSLTNAIFLYFFFAETLTTKSNARFSFFQSFINIKKAIESPVLRKLFSTSFLFQSGFSFFTSFFGAYLIYRFAFTQSNIGNFFALVGILMAITQGFITARVAKRFSTRSEDYIIS